MKLQNRMQCEFSCCAFLLRRLKLRAVAPYSTKDQASKEFAKMQPPKQLIGSLKHHLLAEINV
jgi:hypothetical protein